MYKNIRILRERHSTLTTTKMNQNEKLLISNKHFTSASRYSTDEFNKMLNQTPAIYPANHGINSNNNLMHTSYQNNAYKERSIGESTAPAIDYYNCKSMHFL